MPAPYTFTAAHDLQFPFDGEQVNMSGGDTRTFENACTTIRFLNAARAAYNEGVGEEEEGILNELQDECDAQSGGTGAPAPTPPPTPAPTNDPSATGNDQQPPSNEETSQTLNAPSPATSGLTGREPPAAGEADERPLSVQILDPYNPLPVYDLPDILSAQGVPDGQIDAAIQSILHNEPPEGESHPFFGQDYRPFPSVFGADPLILFTGQYSITSTDVKIPSRGIPIHLTRVYRSGEPFFGPWGYNWDHNYNVYLRPLTDGGAAIWTGSLAEEIYKISPNGDFEPSTGVFRKLEHNSAAVPNPEQYILSDREGMQLIFEQPTGWPRGDRLPLVRIEDRHGNTHRLQYDSEGRLFRVEDHAGRFLQFSYNSCGLLESIIDSASRRWLYQYDTEVEHLIAVSTPGTVEYPKGNTTTYEYDRSQSHPALQHNIIRTKDPSGRISVENEYENDPSSDDFGRVVYQNLGDFEARISTTRLQFVPSVPDAINVPSLRVEYFDPGVLKVYTFNYRGDLLDERFRLSADRSFRLVARAYRYDDQCNLVERREPNGLGIRSTYDNSNTDPRARGNLLYRELLPPATSAASSRVIQTLAYEPQFNRVKSIRNEGGGITTFTYDYEQLVGTKGDVVAIKYPSATLPDGTVQDRIEQFVYNSKGQLTVHITGTGCRHIFAYASSGIADGYLTSITWDVTGASQSQNIEYDVLGHRTAFIDGLGNRTEVVVDDLDRIVRVRLPAIGGVTDEIGFGYTPEGKVNREEWPRGDYNDAVISDPFIVNEYTYDALGNQVSAVFGANTVSPLQYHYKYDPDGKLLSAIDPLGRETLFSYDERGLMLTHTEAASSGLAAVWRFGYDRNGNRTVVTDPAGHRFDYSYDSWDRLTELVLPGAAAERTRISFKLNHYDRVDRLRITGLTAPGVVGVLHESFTDYDERGRPWRRKLDARVTEFMYDADERVVKQTDQRGNTTTFEFDGLNHIIKANDTEGNAIVRSFDAAGNLFRIQTLDSLPGGGNENLTTLFEYDSRLRPFRVIDPLGHVRETEYDARNLAIRDVDPLGRITERSYGIGGELLSVTAQVSPGVTAKHQFRYDAGGRQLSYVDPEGNATAYTFDARDRRTSITYSDGRVHRFSYDNRRQVANEQTPGGTLKTYTYGPDAGLKQIVFAPAPGVVATPPLNQFCDGLRRVVWMEQGGSVLTRSFDASLRIVSETLDGVATKIDYDDAAGQAALHYPDGRKDELSLDSLGRISSIMLSARGSSGLTGTLPVATELARYSYRGISRVSERSLHTGLVTRFDYDNATRMTGVTHTAGGAVSLASIRFVYDAADQRRIVWSDPAPGSPARYDYDGVSRVIAANLRLGITEPPATPDQGTADALIAAAEAMVSASSETYNLNAAEARKKFVRNAGPVATTDNYTLTNTYEITQIARMGTGAGIFPFTFDGDGRCTQDDRFRYRYDAMGRLLEVLRLPGLQSVLAQKFDPAGRVMIRTEGSNSYRQYHLGLRVFERRDTTGLPIAQFTYGVGVDEVIMESSGTNRYPLQDPLSSVLAYIDSSNTVLERYLYSPFGEANIFAPDGFTVRATSAIGGIVRFGGHQLLVSGLYDSRARVYEPKTGRFLQPDPQGYRDASNLYAYTHHDPIGFSDPTGEAAILLGILVVAGAGLLIGGGTNAIRQGIQIHEGSRKEFSWGELGLSAGGGALLAPVMVFAPEVGIPLAAYGVSNGVEEISQGQWETGTFDIVTSLAPFGLKGVRGATFGEGSMFAPSRGLGPSATAAERFARFPELGRATNELAGRIWNQRFYRGTTYYEALGAQEGGLDIATVRNRQVTATAPPRLGSGLYLTQEPGSPNIPGSAEYWANFHGASRGGAGGPAVVEASIPRWRVILLRRQPGVQLNVEQPGFPVHPASRESFFPFEGPNNLPPSGPGAEFSAAARWRIWDPSAPEPDVSGIWPSLMARPPFWWNPPSRAIGNK